jgi:hypothetical protein
MHELDPSSNLCLAITEDLFILITKPCKKDKKKKIAIKIRITVARIARYYGNFFLFLFSLQSGNINRREIS